MQPLGSRYFLETSIGRGSFGQVWRAQDRSGRTFAVKVLRPDLATDPDVVARFVRERTMIVGLTSPHLVPVHDFVVEGDTLAIVMDLIEGHDLREELRQQGTFTPAAALRTAAAVCRGLTVVHARGIVHRDIKPSNILLDPAGNGVTAKITDFGVGWLYEDAHVTSTSSLVGTPEYMAPEYALGEPVTPAVDLYAVGVMLYEMLCGVTPFVGGNPMAVLNRQIHHSATRPSSMPAEVWEIVEQLLVKEAYARPVAALAAIALARLADSVGDLPAAEKLAAPPASTPISDTTGRVSSPAADPTLLRTGTDRITTGGRLPTSADTGGPGAASATDTAATMLRGRPGVVPVFAPVTPVAMPEKSRPRRKLALIAAGLTALLLVGGGTAMAVMNRSSGPDQASVTTGDTDTAATTGGELSGGAGATAVATDPASIAVEAQSAAASVGSGLAVSTSAAGLGAQGWRQQSQSSAGSGRTTTVLTSVASATTTVVSGRQTVIPETTVTTTVVDAPVVPGVDPGVDPGVGADPGSGPPAGPQPDAPTIAPDPAQPTVSDPPVTSEPVVPPADPTTTEPPAAEPPSIQTDSLPGATTGESYRATLSGSGTGALSWSVSSGALPDGMSLSSDGVISADQVTGTSDAAFTVRATDGASGLTADRELTIAVTVPPPPPPPEPEPADPAYDVNSDGAVDCGDVDIVNAHLDSPGGFGDGDVTGDGQVDAADADAVRTHLTDGGNC